MTISTAKGNFDLAQIEENRMAIKQLQHKFNVFVEESIQSINELENNLKTKVSTGDFTKFEEEIGKLIDNLKNELKDKADQSNVTSQGNKITSLETSVGNASSGLVKKVTDLENADTGINAKLGAIKTWITTKGGDDTFNW